MSFRGKAILQRKEICTEKQADQIYVQSTDQHALISIIHTSQAFGSVSLNWAVLIKHIKEFKRNLGRAVKKQGEYRDKQFSEKEKGMNLTEQVAFPCSVDFPRINLFKE